MRELPVDQPADQVDPLQVEQDLIPCRRKDDIDRVVGVGEDPGQLVERASRNYHAGFLDRIEHGQSLDRDAVVVRRGQGQLVTLKTGQDAGKDRSGLIGSGSEGDLAQGVFGASLPDLAGWPKAQFGQDLLHGHWIV